MLKRSLLAAVVALPLVACSGNPEPKNAKAGQPSGASANKGPGADDAPPGTIARKSLDSVLLRRPGYVLSRVQMEEVLKQNKFVGWRLTSFPAEWDKTGLQPGDVVTELNGVALEKPEDLWTAWLALADAAEIRIGFERDGKASSTSVKIHGAPVAETKVALETGTGMPAAEPAPGERPAKKPARRKDTIVITDESANPGDDDSSAVNY